MHAFAPYIALYDAQRCLLEEHSPALLGRYREEARRCLEHLSPTFYGDDYAPDYGVNLPRYRVAQQPYTYFTCEILSIGAYQFLVLDDVYYPNPHQELPAGLTVCGLAEACLKYPQWVEPYLFRQMQWEKSPEQAFNVLLAQDGLFVHLAPGVQVDKPLQLINLMHGKTDTLAVSHNLVVVEEGASAQLLVCDHAIGQAQYLTNRVTELFVQRGAMYQHYKVDHTGVRMTNNCSLLSRQQEDSRIKLHLVTLHNHHTVNQVRASIEGRGANLFLGGLAMGDKQQKICNDTLIEHKTPQAVSSELFKYILDGQAEGDFYGTIRVWSEAQQTSAQQTNRNLCLSADARMHTRPQLEIYADDVKCNHGATVGQLDDTALFYLRSRGIPEAEARMLLLYAFVHDVLENIALEPLRDRLKLLVEKRLRSGMLSCGGCKICDKV